MKKYILLLIWFIGIQINAQELMRVTTQDGTQYELSINNIKNLDFYTPEQINFVGEWITISAGSMVCFDIKSDGTMKHTSFSTTDATKGNYFEIDGTYTIKDNVLTLNFDGSTLVIPVVEATETKIVSTSGETYYRVQADIYSLTTNGNPISVGNEGDVVKYTDRCFIDAINNMITPLRDGRGYVIVEEARTGVLKAFGVNVLYVPESPIDWSKYFKKSKDELISELGEPAQKERFTYTNFNASIHYITFTFNENKDEATKVHLTFYDETKRLHYCDSIERHYILNRESASSKIYFDTEDINAASVKVTVYYASVMCVIVYEDLKPTPAPPSSVVDWTQYFKKTGDQIKAEFGNDPTVTDDDEDEDYSYIYSKNIGDLKRLTFDFTKGFEKVISVKASFKDSNSMQNYRDAIAAKYILYSETETRKTYYDADTPSTASVRVVIQSSGSTHYITYTDMSE